MGLFKKSKLDQIEASRAPDPTRPIIMIVDDEEANLRVMAAIVSPLYRVVLARDGQEALDLIGTIGEPEKLACIISDQRMPRLTGVELFQQAHILLPRTIRIIVTGFIDLDAIVDSINKAEIYKFIIKPFDTNDFILTIQRAVETFELRQQLHVFYRNLEQKVLQRTQELANKNQELQQAYQKLEDVSLTDSLTGLRNRRFLLKQLDADIASSLRLYDESQTLEGGPAPVDADLVFLMVDLDHFKKVNDEYGHAAGDAVLIQIRERLQEVSRDSDYLVRWGGEEFMVVARSCNRSEAEAMARRISGVIANREFALPDGTLLSKTCSVGFACFPFFVGQPRLISWTQVAELADQGLYMAKRSGRNRWYGLLGVAPQSTEGLYMRIRQGTEQAVMDGEMALVTGSA